jgi:hypothetical protein
VARAPERDRDPADGLLERLELLGEDDEAIAAFLDSIEVRSPREREMLAELARRKPLADRAAFRAAHARLVGALEALGRHGYHSSSAGRRLGPLRPVVRLLVELVARYLVVSHLRGVSFHVRNLYWLREMQSEPGSDERVTLRRARRDAEGLTLVFNRRQIGVPTFLFGGILVSLGATAGRVARGITTGDLRAALLVGLVGFAVALAISWVALRGTAMASRRIRLSVRQPLIDVLRALGHAGRPPRDQSRKLALVAIGLTFGGWVIIPLVVGIALAAA